MLSTTQLVLNALAVLLLPFVILSLALRDPPADGTFLGRLYRTDRNLHLVSDLFLLALCLTCLVNLGLHFGVIDIGKRDLLAILTGVPFMSLLLIYLGLLVRAARRLHNRNASSKV